MGKNGEKDNSNTIFVIVGNDHGLFSWLSPYIEEAGYTHLTKYVKCIGGGEERCTIIEIIKNVKEKALKVRA